MTERGFGLGTNGDLILKYPASWSNSVKRVISKNMTFDAPFFIPTNSNDFNFMIELVLVGDKHNTNVAVFKSALITAGRTELTNAVETSIDVHEVEGYPACLFRLTDKRWVGKSPPPGEFKYLTRGYAAVGPLVLTFSLVSNDYLRDEPAAIDVIKHARYEKQPVR
jgi:hypothetical protein